MITSLLNRNNWRSRKKQVKALQILKIGEQQKTKSVEHTSKRPAK